MRNLVFALLLVGCSRVEPLQKTESSSSSIEEMRNTTDSALCLLEEMGKRKDTVLRVTETVKTVYREEESSRPIYSALVRVKPDTVFIYRVDTVYIVK